VFVYESLLAARKRQVYALRSLFVAVLLFGIWSSWQSLENQYGSYANNPALQRQVLSQLGQRVYNAVAPIQLAFVLLAAPAATAGAVCLDRARGALAHALVTDLSDAEIVLGKLFARLTPVVGLIAASVPVLAIAMLLGGMIPQAVAFLFAASVATAVLGASLALVVSVRVRKTHEVLMAVYSAWFLWLMSAPAWEGIARNNGLPGVPRWYWMLNPFALVFAPYLEPAETGISDLFLYLVVVAVVSMGLAVVAVRTLRREPAAERRRSERWERVREIARARFYSWLPSPTLDGNPVLWREWHRNRPSRVARRIWGLYAVGMVVGTALGLGQLAVHGAGVVPPVTLIVNVFGVSLGLLFLSALAPTALTEERTRGSLDVLMTTPLSTASIVLGKWWGTFRVVPKLAALPALGSIVFAMATPDVPARWFMPSTPPPLDAVDHAAAAVLPIVWVIAHGAAITSVGLLLATWLARPGKAVTLSVVYLLLLTIGAPVFVETFIRPVLNQRAMAAFQQAQMPPIAANAGSPRIQVADFQEVNGITAGLTTLSPFAGQVVSAEFLVNRHYPRLKRLWAIQAVLIAATFTFAAAVLGLTVLTFDRCLERVRERPRAPGANPLLPAGAPAGTSRLPVP
jgi:ABC-type transport system involved in multi-copper enzyme maturation permease subunit